jgi:hypothetical protein
MAIWAIAAILLLGVVGLAGWRFLISPQPSAPLAATSTATEPTQPAALPLATEAEILAHRADMLTVFRFAPNPAILVFDFPDLREQGLMFNRIAAFAEKAGEPHDRVLTDSELDHAIHAHGDTVETYYYGHDYSAETLRRFFALADRDHVALFPEEERLRAFLTAQGLLAGGASGAIITVPREGADALIDAQFRRTILHHELSHGEYFTNPAYADYVHKFWEGGMDETVRSAFRRFLIAQDYDPALGDLTVNEMQAYLMHTNDRRAFSAEAMGLPEAALHRLQTNFLRGMPAGWLHDDTRVPPLATPASAKTPRLRLAVRVRRVAIGQRVGGRILRRA